VELEQAGIPGEKMTMGGAEAEKETKSE
jgi:hypothetical protein